MRWNEEQQMKTAFSLVVLSIAIAVPPSHGDMIYNVSFEDPPHTLNSPVANGGGIDQPSGTIGSVIARSGIADFSSQVASLEPAGLMSFFSDSPISSGLVLLSWDLAIIGFGPGGLSDTAQVSVNSSGTGPLLMTWQRDFDFTIGGASVATFALDQQDHYEVLLDLDNDTYDFAFNGVPVLTNQAVESSFNVHYVNFGSENLQSPTYAVDNFRWEVVPEPSTWLLISTGCLAAVYGRRIAGSK